MVEGAYGYFAPYCASAFYKFPWVILMTSPDSGSREASDTPGASHVGIIRRSNLSRL